MFHWIPKLRFYVWGLYNICILIFTISGINLQKYDIYSFYQPDSIIFFESNGKGYIVTANEGDTVEYEAGGVLYVDSKRGRQMLEG